jgi:hypothetical protein
MAPKKTFPKELFWQPGLNLEMMKYITGLMPFILIGAILIIRQW